MTVIFFQLLSISKASQGYSCDSMLLQKNKSCKNSLNKEYSYITEHFSQIGTCSYILRGQENALL